MAATQEKGVSKQTASKMGLVGAVSVIITSVIGIGIFFKNGGVFSMNNNNCVGILVSWILSAIIAMFTAFSYIEIASSKKTAGTNAGLGGWANDFVGYNMGRAVKIWMPTWNYAFKCLAMAVFGAMAIFNIFFCYKTDDSYNQWFGHNTMLYSTLLALGIIIFFMVVNYFSNKFGDKFSQVSTFMKFVPVLVVAVVGIAFGAQQGGGIWTGKVINPEKGISQPGDISATGILNSLPAIMFAFDGFLIIGNVAAKVKNPRKNVSYSIVIAMIIVTVLNLTITIGCITTGNGNPFEMFKIAFGTKVVDAAGTVTYQATTLSTVFTIAIAAFISFSAIACVNAYVMAGVGALQECIDEESVMFANYFKKVKSGDQHKLAATLYFAAFMAVFGIIISIPSCLMNTDQIWDGTTVVGVVAFYGIYALVICGGLANRRTYRSEVQRSKLFVPSAFIGIIGCMFVAVYSLFYTYLGNMFEYTNGTMNAMSAFGGWGLSFTPSSMKSGYFQGWVAACLFWLLFVLFVIYPFLNDFAIMLTNKNYPHALMWQKEDTQSQIIVATDAPVLPAISLREKKLIKKMDARRR